MGQVRHGSATTTHAVRAAIQRSTARQGHAKHDPDEGQARSVAQLSEELGINPKTVAGASARRSDRADRLDGSDRGRGSGDRCLSTPYPAAAGRLPLRPAATDPAPDAVGAAPVPAATWHFPPAGRRGGQTEATTVQALPDRVLPHPLPPSRDHASHDRGCGALPRRSDSATVTCRAAGQAIAKQSAGERGHRAEVQTAEGEASSLRGHRREPAKLASPSARPYSTTGGTCRGTASERNVALMFQSTRSIRISRAGEHRDAAASSAADRRTALPEPSCSTCSRPCRIADLVAMRSALTGPSSG